MSEREGKQNGARIIGWTCIGVSAAGLVVSVLAYFYSGNPAMIAFLPVSIGAMVPGIILVAAANRKKTETP